MKKIKIGIVVLVAVAISPLLNNLDMPSVFNTIGVLLSVLIGFTMTSLSIIATSKFSSRLYKMECCEDNSKTLLHELVNEFYNKILLFVLTLSLIILCFFVGGIRVPIFEIYSISFFGTLEGVIFGLVGLSLYEFIMLFKIFKNFIIKTAING